MKTRGTKAIPGVVSVAEASRQLKMNPHFVKGMALGLGVDVRKAGRTFILTVKDVERIRREASRPEVAALLR